MKHYPPVREAAGKAVQVEAMFDAIAPRYDLLNRLLSLGMDQYWRRRAVQMLIGGTPRRVLDVATGTGDLAIAASRIPEFHVTGVDIAEAMLSRARSKAAHRGRSIKFLQADARSLPFSDEAFDAVTVGFGIRNFEDLNGSLVELHRVIAPGGKLVVLEFSKPRLAVVRWLSWTYERVVVPGVGRLVSRDKGAYRYLPDSIASFTASGALSDRFTQAGFEKPECHPLTFGVASLYVAQKPGTSVTR